MQILHHIQVNRTIINKSFQNSFTFNSQIPKQ